MLRQKPEDLRPADPALGPTSTEMGEAVKAWGIALDLVFMTVGGLLVGWLIDRWQDTNPWGALIGLALGFVTGFVRLVRTSLRADAREQAQKRQPSGGGRANKPRP